MYLIILTQITPESTNVVPFCRMISPLVNMCNILKEVQHKRSLLYLGDGSETCFALPVLQSSSVLDPG